MWAYFKIFKARLPMDLFEVLSPIKALACGALILKVQLEATLVIPSYTVIQRFEIASHAS